MNSPPPVTPYSPYYALSDIYRNLRDLILHLPSQRLESGNYGTIGALMETGHPSAISTLVALSDGTTSLYISSGGGITGAGGHAPVVEAAGTFIDTAEACTPSLHPAVNYPVPQPKTTRFYLLTSTGVWTAEAPDVLLAKKTSPLFPMFFAGQAVITAIRENLSTTG